MREKIKTFYIATFGCKTNQFDSASISAQLQEEGLTRIKTAQAADLIIINTCTVTERADYKARQLARKLRRSGSDKKIVMTGCYPQRGAKELMEMNEIDLLTDNGLKKKFSSILDILSSQENGLTNSTKSGFGSITVDDFQDMTRALLKIQDGCDRSCSYCIVPLVRGKSRSLEADEIAGRVKNLEHAEYKEVILTGIHIGLWGSDLGGGSNLKQLLEEILRETKSIRIRLSSLESCEISEDLIDFIQQSSRIRPHFHIPLQSGSPRILKLMNRDHQDLNKFAELVRSIEQKFSHPAIGADVIVGFPGETDKEFRQTCTFVADLPFNYLHVFPFSVRPGTRAEHLPDRVEDSIKTDRARELRELAERERKAFIEAQIGTTREALTLGKKPTNGKTSAITDNYLKIEINSFAPINENINITLTAFKNGKIFAEAI